MRKFNKLVKFTLNRFAIWLAAIAIFLTMILGVSLKNNISEEFESFKTDAENIWKDVDRKTYPENLTFDENTIDKLSINAMKYKNKYKLMEYEDLWSKTSDEQTAYFDRLDSQEGSYTAHYTYGNFQNTFRKIKDGRLDTSEYFKSLLAPIIIFIALFALSLTSLEQSMPIFEFTRMMPWKKRDDLLMKAAISFIFGLGIFLINVLVLSLIFKASAFGSFLSLKIAYGQIFKNILILLGTSLLATSLGYIAGNFVGHFGLFVLALGGLEIIKADLAMALSVFSENISNRLSLGYDNFIERQNIFIKTLTSLIYLDVDSLKSIAAFLVLAVLGFILASLVIRKSTSEKSGYMIVSKPIGIFCKILASLTLANLITSLVMTVTYQASPIIGIVSFALALLLSYKFFDILFNIRLKF